MLIRSWCTKLVGSGLNDSGAIGFGGGGYKLAQKIRAQWTYIPQMNKPLMSPGLFDGNFHLDGTASEIVDIDLSAQQEISVENNSSNATNGMAI